MRNHTSATKRSRRDFLCIGAAAATSQLVSAWQRRCLSAAEPPPELFRASAHQLAILILRKKASSLEVVNACLEQIERVNPRINAVVTLIAQEARATARLADQALARGDVIGPLHGVPMTIKDSLDTAGVVTTAGTSGRKTCVPKQDATVVKRLKAAGAILLGKTNTPELTWAFETNNPVFGVTNNPYNSKFSPGGSSGGAAAIVAACGVPFDIGSDTGGSIRVPSHFCGVTGIKPTSGRVPRTGHVISAEGYMQSLTQLGPIARCVDDLSYILPILVGPDGRDASVVPQPLADHARIEFKRLRIAVHTDNGIVSPHHEVAQVVTNAAKVLEQIGAQIEQEKPVALDDVLRLDDDLYRADGAASLRRLLAQTGTMRPGPDIVAALDKRPMSSGEMAEFIERWDAWRGRMLQFFDRFDAILCPPCAFADLPHGTSTTAQANAAFSYTFAYNMTGWPAAVVRAGTSSKGLPIGIQVIGKPWREDIVLAIANEIEQSLGGYHAPSD
ncbi:MAG: amidase [Planctomycetota bacterium]